MRELPVKSDIETLTGAGEAPLFDTLQAAGYKIEPRWRATRAGIRVPG